MKPGFTTLPIDTIEVGDRKREAGDVSDLAQSIEKLGLHRLLLEHFHQVVKGLLGFWIKELVIIQLFGASGEVWW